MADDLEDDWFVKEDIDVDQDSDDVTTTEGLIPGVFTPLIYIRNSMIYHLKVFHFYLFSLTKFIPFLRTN